MNTTTPQENTPSPVAAAPDAALLPHVEGVVEGAAETIGEAGQLSFTLIWGIIIGLLAYTGELLILLGQGLRSVRRLHASDLVTQMAVIGVETIPIGLLTVGFSGAVLSLYSVNTLRAYGASDLVGGIVALSIVRETGPILAGVVLAARAGSAMTAEIGSMKVTEQIDALRSMAISPIEYLVTPRLVAGIIMLPVVTLFADAAGVFGGGIVASSMGVSASAYLSSVRQLVDPSGVDLYKGLLKTVVFGAIVALIGCREGMNTEGGAVGVGRSTTRSVVIAIVLVFFANFILSFLLFNSGLI